MKRISRLFAVALPFLMAILVGLAAAPWGARAAEVQGKFTAVGPVPAAKSAETVVVEEYLNFTCPHCNDFRNVSKSVFDKYGKRLRLVRMPLLFRGQTDTPLRLFYVAQAHGKETEIADALFDSAFRFSVNIYDPAVVNYLARTNGLAEAYQKDGNANWVTERIAAAAARANTYNVDSTPTLVIQGALKMTPDTKMETFVGQFDEVVAQLLK